ncbi:MAG: hypothetical protein ACLFQX_02790 [Candidatus Kapaibacterium sp.]
MARAEKVLKNWRESTSKQKVSLNEVEIVISHYLADLCTDRKNKGGSHRFIIQHEKIKERNIDKFDTITIPVDGKLVKSHYIKKLIKVIDLRLEGEI